VSYLIDTNVITELRKGRRANARFRRWFRTVDETALYLSVLVLGELREVVESLRRRDPSAAGLLERWIHELVHRHGERVIGIDVTVADQWGRLAGPEPLSTVDGLLAATALVHSLTLVTRNAGDVQRTGVRQLDPFV
jgi:toxin FitB